MSTKDTKKDTKAKSEKTVKLTAVQRIDFLEKIIMEHATSINVLADEIDRLRNSVVNLSRRLDASIEATDSSSEVRKIQLQKSVEELKGRVDFLVENKALVKETEGEVTLDSFVVGRELDSEKNEVNPRTQFAIPSLEKTLQDMIVGRKLGEMVEQEDGSFFEILELYTMNRKAVSNQYEDEGSEETESEKSA